MHTKKYRSKIDISELLPTVAVILSIATQVFFSFGSILIIIFGMQLIFQIIKYFNLFYYITPENSLTVKNGWFFRCNINIQEINSIVPSRVNLGSPTMSINGLEVTYLTTKKIYLTPVNEAEFMQTLIQLNPQIVVNFNTGFSDSDQLNSLLLK